MAGITLAQAEARLALYVAAEAAVLLNQSYRIGDRELTRADLGEIRKGLAEANAQVQALSAAALGRRRTRYGVIG